MPTVVTSCCSTLCGFGFGKGTHFPLTLTTAVANTSESSPFTPLFRKFLFSNIRFTSKVTIISYIGTYYAIGAAWILTVANYFAIGWFNGYLDKYYIDSWKVWFSIVIVFNGLGNFALATMRYRIGERSWFGSLMENFKWTLMFAIFLGGLSLHVSQALLSHMFEINMTWVSHALFLFSFTPPKQS